MDPVKYQDRNVRRSCPVKEIEEQASSEGRSVIFCSYVAERSVRDLDRHAVGLEARPTYEWIPTTPVRSGLQNLGIPSPDPGTIRPAGIKWA